MKEKVKKPFYKKWWWWLIVLIVIGAVASAGDEESSASPDKNTPSTEENKKEPKKNTTKKTEKPAAIGEEVTAGKVAYTVKSVKETKVIENILGNKETEGKFVIVELSVKNLDTESRTIDSNMFKIKTNDGAEYSSDSTLDMYANEGGIGFFLQKINPNLSKTGKVVFELPADAKKYNLEVSSGFGFSGGKYKQIKLK